MTDFLPQDANQFIEEQLHIIADQISEIHDANVLSLYGPIFEGVDDLIRHAVESCTEHKDKLLFILETPGGSIEIVERIVLVLRKHYSTVEFAVPDRAMSAGTVLALSGDDIYMDYYSLLGPIDTQVETARGFVPVMGYLKRFEELKKSMDEKEARGEDITTADVLLLKGFDQAELYLFRNFMDFTKDILIKWLTMYKFKIGMKPTHRKSQSLKR